MRALRSLTEPAGIALIEDAAGALGASAAGQSVGSWGDFAAFSLGPTKPLSAGEGGFLVCRQREGYARATSATQHPLRALLRGGDADLSAWLGTAGLNYRMHPLTAALALSQWPGFPERLEARRRWAEALSEALPAELPFRPLRLDEPVSWPAGHRLLLHYEADEADQVPVEGIRQALAAEGVRMAVCSLYPPLDRLPLFRGEPAPPRALWSGVNLKQTGKFPCAQAWCNHEIVLTTGEATGTGWEIEIEEVVAAFVKVWKQRAELAERPEKQGEHSNGKEWKQWDG
jgi:dTDP-4-amino-4,6-dideoxygalactose transaminase